MSGRSLFVEIYRTAIKCPQKFLPERMGFLHRRISHAAALGRDISGRAATGRRTMAAGHTTASRRPVVSKCAFSRGPIKRAEHPGHPWTLPLRSSPAGRSPPFLTVSSYHKRTASQCNVGVVKPPFIHYIPETVRAEPHSAGAGRGGTGGGSC